MATAAFQSDASIKLVKSWIEALINGDRGFLAHEVGNALALGVSPRTLYIDALFPAGHAVERLHQRGRIGETKLRRAQEILTFEAVRLCQHAETRDNRHSGGAIVVSAEGDPYVTLLRGIADCLYFEGFLNEVIQESTLSEDLFAFVVERRPTVLCFTASSPGFVEIIRNFCRVALRTIETPLTFVTCPELDPEAASAFSGHAESLGQALLGIRTLLSEGHRRTDLAQVLVGIGKRVQAVRRARGFSQLELATRSKLDRTYISSLEHGRENLTLGAIVRLANALDVDLGELLQTDASPGAQLPKKAFS